MPKNATRKCYIKRNNATKKLAAQRRKLSEELLTFNQKVHQLLLDTANGMYKDMQKGKDFTNSKVGKYALKMLDPQQMAKLLYNGYLMSQQIKHLPPMSAQQETQLIEQLKHSLDKGLESLHKIKKNKAVKPIPFENPYPLRETGMPNLYIETGTCAWEAEDVGALYKKRQAAVKAFYNMFNKHMKSLEGSRKGAQAELFEAIERNMMLMKTLPPGPNKEAEEERIAYLEIANDFIDNVIQMMKVMMKELRNMILQMKKEMAKK